MIPPVSVSLLFCPLVRLVTLTDAGSAATSPTVRNVLATHPQLRDVLYSIDQLRGEDRNDALQRALGVSASDLHAHSRPGLARNVTQPQEDTRALRELAEAIEAAVRGGKEDALGLDWGD
ncbi:hypothetical protein PHLCEN_2v13154 [Hermanssonia centrifuga]|uniref:Uncharacterized protein n=1 Tax=Hermanssonia centrifuga TaxID=98765 RepID=A0A2R6NFE2_9APHY|nr:hypothetical protein PHLCEN_2v13154 [Hermanssonia centrifuga]